MPALQSSKTSVRTRLRQLTTMCCVLAALGGVLGLAGGHVIHGALMVLGAVLLVPGTIWGRRRQPHLKLVYSSSAQAPEASASKGSRKVA